MDRREEEGRSIELLSFTLAPSPESACSKGEAPLALDVGAERETARGRSDTFYAFGRSGCVLSQQVVPMLQVPKIKHYLLLA